MQINENAMEKINRLLEETEKSGSKYEKGKSFLTGLRRNMAAKALKTMGKDRTALRKKGENEAANFYDNERRAYSASRVPKSKEAITNKNKTEVFDGFNTAVYKKLGSSPRWMQSAKS